MAPHESNVLLVNRLGIPPSELLLAAKGRRAKELTAQRMVTEACGWAYFSVLKRFGVGNKDISDRIKGTYDKTAIGDTKADLDISLKVFQTAVTMAYESAESFKRNKNPYPVVAVAALGLLFQHRGTDLLEFEIRAKAFRTLIELAEQDARPLVVFQSHPQLFGHNTHLSTSHSTLPDTNPSHRQTQ